jgi:hypothetical protein
VYVALFLVREHRSMLLQAVPPRHVTVHADHMTVVHAPSAEQLTPALLACVGLPVSLMVTGVCSGRHVQAATVCWPDQVGIVACATQGDECEEDDADAEADTLDIDVVAGAAAGPGQGTPSNGDRASTGSAGGAGARDTAAGIVEPGATGGSPCLDLGGAPEYRYSPSSAGQDPAYDAGTSEFAAGLGGGSAAWADAGGASTDPADAAAKVRTALADLAPDNALSINAVPHVTISTAAGVGAAESNVVLRRRKRTRWLASPFVVRARLGLVVVGAAGRRRFLLSAAAWQEWCSKASMDDGDG